MGDWSAAVWGGGGREDATIGVGRATGGSRAPQGDLVRDPRRIERAARDLNARVDALERGGRALVDGRATAAAADEWSAIVGEFRVLTASITAAAADRAAQGSDRRRMAVFVYESAADASLLAGNLAFYCTCQSRLLRDLYPGAAAGAAARAAEFYGYSLLYYAVFARDGLEVACHLRGAAPALAQAPEVRLALAAAASLAGGQYYQFCALYASDGTSRRQRTIMFPALARVRAAGVRAMARAYLTLDAATAAAWLGFAPGEAQQVRDLLVQLVPALAAVNGDATAPLLYFRCRRP